MTDRLTTFAETYAVAVLRAVVDLNMHTAGKTPQQFALDATLTMLDTIESHGIDSVEHYVINHRGGAFLHTAEALGVEPTAKALQYYLEG